jgi:hypothetical protein
VEEEEAPVGAEAGGREMGLLGGCSWAQAVAARRRRSNAVGAMDAAEEGGGRRGLLRVGLGLWWKEPEFFILRRGGKGEATTNDAGFTSFLGACPATKSQLFKSFCKNKIQQSATKIHPISSLDDTRRDPLKLPSLQKKQQRK